MFKKEEQRESVGSGFVNDNPSSHDSLGFEPYIKGITNFIKDPATKAPLTISIEGEWGSGKSSFMKQLREHLRKSDPNSYSVWFDSWRYNKEEGIWAAFALSFLQQVSAQRSFFIRPWLRRRLRWKRLQKGESKFWMMLLRQSPIWLIDFLFLIVLVGLPIVYFSTIAQPLWETFLNISKINSTNQKAIELAVKLVPIFPWLILVFKEFRGTASGLLEYNLNKYIKDPKYQDHLELINRFHEDFRLMIENYASNKRVYLYIDDLDRCDAGKAAELMQAINMMVHDYPQIIFIIAMDRKKVAAGYAMHHEKILTYLAPNILDEEGNVDPTSVAQQGLQYGYSYIEKFIQVPFWVPKPNQVDIKKFLDEGVKGEKESTKDSSGTNQKAIKRRIAKLVFKRDSSSQINSINTNNQNENALGARKIHQDNLRVFLDVEDSMLIKHITAITAPYLDYNPRRIKQFLNIFRLYGYLADELGILRYKNGLGGGERGLSLEQLGKVVALSLKWPQFISEAMDNAKFIQDFLQYVYSETDDNTKNLNSMQFKLWKNEEKLIKLLREGCEKPNGQVDPKLTPRFGLNAVNIVELFKVAEPVFRLSNSNFNKSNISLTVLREMSQESFMDLVINLLKNHFNTETIEVINKKDWGQDLKVLLPHGEIILVNIEKMFSMVDVHSVEYVTDVMKDQEIKRAMLITNGYFENAAIQYAGQHNIDLWGGEELVSILTRYGYNVEAKQPL